MSPSEGDGLINDVRRIIPEMNKSKLLKACTVILTIAFCAVAVSYVTGDRSHYSSYEISHPASIIAPMGDIRKGSTASGPCPPKTFRTQSDRTWVEFRLPSKTVGSIINFKGGSYYRYVFPKCHRATWTDLAFVCGESSVWVLAGGSMDADALCTTSNIGQQYLYVGDR